MVERRFFTALFIPWPPHTFGTTRKVLEHLWNKIGRLKGDFRSFQAMVGNGIN